MMNIHFVTTTEAVRTQVFKRIYLINKKIVNQKHKNKFWLFIHNFKN